MVLLICSALYCISIGFVMGKLHERDESVLSFILLVFIGILWPMFFLALCIIPHNKPSPNDNYNQFRDTGSGL